MEAKIIEYFDYVEETKQNPTVTGLALYMGYCETQSLWDQEKRSDEYSLLIKRARNVIIRHHENRLSGTTPTGSIFWLKNYGWTDRTEIDHLNNGNSFNTLTDAELVARVVKLIKPDKEG
jgi:hypothetical protein